VTAKRVGFGEWLRLAWAHDELMRLAMVNMVALMFPAFILALYADLWLLPLGLGGAFLYALLWRWRQDIKREVWYLQAVEVGE